MCVPASSPALGWFSLSLSISSFVWSILTLKLPPLVPTAYYYFSLFFAVSFSVCFIAHLVLSRGSGDRRHPTAWAIFSRAIKSWFCNVVGKTLLSWHPTTATLVFRFNRVCIAWKERNTFSYRKFFLSSFLRRELCPLPCVACIHQWKC